MHFSNLHASRLFHALQDAKNLHCIDNHIDVDSTSTMNGTVMLSEAEVYYTSTILSESTTLVDYYLINKSCTSFNHEVPNSLFCKVSNDFAKEHLTKS